MDRDELEREILKRMPTVQSDWDTDIIKNALRKKSTEQLEDLLKRMKEAER